MADKKSIWCLFSVEINHDQPDNNLVRFWFERPSIEELARFLASPLDKANDDDIVKIVSVWQGQPQTLRFSDASYRLQKVDEGEGL